MVILFLGIAFFTSFIYSSLVVAKRADEYEYKDEKE